MAMTASYTGNEDLQEKLVAVNRAAKRGKSVEEITG